MNRVIPAPEDIRAFVRESNKIEGVDAVLAKHYELTCDFLAQPIVSVGDLQRFAAAMQPGALIRDKKDMDVKVGDHVAPPGGREIVRATRAILDEVEAGMDPWRVYCEFQNLHPFTDCNGRTGRALWAWQMVRRGHALERGFLAEFHYQALSSYDELIREVEDAVQQAEEAIP